MEKMTIKYLKEGGKFKDLQLSSNWKKSDFQSGGAKKPSKKPSKKVKKKAPKKKPAKKSKK